MSRIRPVPPLTLTSPFFGSCPPALLLIEADLKREDLPNNVAKTIDESVTSISALSRATLAFGRKFFDDFRLPRPTRLRPLHFNFDPDDDRLDHSDRHILLALETNHACLAEALHILKILEAVIENQLLHVGLRIPSNRDHLGFVDGTSNLQELPAAQFDQIVFVQQEDDPLYAGGTYLVLRKYREESHLWHELPTAVQEQFIGRKREGGEFLNGQHTFTSEAWTTTPAFAHVRCANPRLEAPGSFDWRERMFRRSIPYTTRSQSGEEESGLLFLALARDPAAQVEQPHNTRMQPMRGRRDLLLSSGYVVPLRSACYYFHHPPDTASTP